VVDVYWKGDFTRFEQLLAEAPREAASTPVTALARFNVQFFQRKFDDALAALAATPFENMRGATSAPLPKSFLAGQVYRAMGNAEASRAAYEQALRVAERAVLESPDEPARHMVLALIYAGLGRKEEALREGNRAVEILPETKDALNGPILQISLARIHTFAGDHEEAISLLERSLKTPGGTTVNELRFDPTWDALRQNERFQALIAATPDAAAR
jgi:tetratricopeptide (TPR) repeat protein